MDEVLCVIFFTAVLLIIQRNGRFDTIDLQIMFCVRSRDFSRV